MSITAKDKLAHRIDLVLNDSRKLGIATDNLAMAREEVIERAVTLLEAFASVLNKVPDNERSAMVIRAASTWPILHPAWQAVVHQNREKAPKGPVAIAEPPTRTLLPSIGVNPTVSWLEEHVDIKALHKQGVDGATEQIGEILSLALGARWSGCDRAPRDGMRFVDPPDNDNRGDWPKAMGIGLEGFAVLYTAWTEQQRSTATARIKFDNTKANHAVVGAMAAVARNDVPGLSNEGEHGSLTEQACRGRQRGKTSIILHREGRPIQLGFDLEGFSAQDQVIAQLAQSPERLVKHWVGLFHLLTTGPEALPQADWNITRHMRIIGYEPRSIEDDRCRRRVIREMEALLRLRIYVERNGVEYFRGPIFSWIERGDIEHSGGKKRQIKKAWTVSISPVLFGGVIPSLDGQKNERWTPLPPTLPKRTPEAVALGAIIAGRFRWFLCKDESSEAELRLSGQNAINMAGIKYQANNPGRAQGQLEAALRELHDERLIEQWRWDGEGGLLDRVLVLAPHSDFLDVGQFGLKRKAQPPAVPRNGAELRLWRTEHGFTQSEAATHLGIRNRKTICRAEGAPNSPLPPSLRKIPVESWA